MTTVLAVTELHRSNQSVSGLWAAIDWLQNLAICRLLDPGDPSISGIVAIVVEVGSPEHPLEESDESRES